MKAVFDNLVHLEHANIVKFHKYWADTKENRARVSLRPGKTLFGRLEIGDTSLLLNLLSVFINKLLIFKNETVFFIFFLFIFVWSLFMRFPLIASSPSGDFHH